MKQPAILITGTKDRVGSAVTDQPLATAKIHEITSAQAWFAGGERIGYDPNAPGIVRAQIAPLSVFLRREGPLAHTVSFLPGFPRWLVWMVQGSAVSTGRCESLLRHH